MDANRDGPEVEVTVDRNAHARPIGGWIMKFIVTSAGVRQVFTVESPAYVPLVQWRSLVENQAEIDFNFGLGGSSIRFEGEHLVLFGGASGASRYWLRVDKNLVLPKIGAALDTAVARNYEFGVHPLVGLAGPKKLTLVGAAPQAKPS